VTRIQPHAGPDSLGYSVAHFTMHANATIARALSAAFLAGPFKPEAMVERGAHLLGRRAPWLVSLARRLCQRFAEKPKPRSALVEKLILHDPGFLRACDRHSVRVAEWLRPPAAMSPVAAADSWSVPSIRTAGELTNWLGISNSALAWFADLKCLAFKYSRPKLRHYHYRPLRKRDGQVRLIEAPKPRLKEIQRQILSEILDPIPLHAAAHGFRHARSIKTFAAPHVGKQVVLRLDLREFFPSISRARIQALFCTAGYPETVASLLAGLCTNRAPEDIWEEASTLHEGPHGPGIRSRYALPHLPQGAPTSPALANLAAYRLDCRLTGLAQSAGAVYTRYADDLAFSGGEEFQRVVKRFALHVCAAAIEEGFAVHHRKTRIMRHGVRQRLAGIVVNDRLNVMRADYDRLKATLTNCIRHGVTDQNRAGHENFRAHLLGRVAFVDSLNATRGRRLHDLFDQISW
jgi:RNA-directed DNA polymerase